MFKGILYISKTAYEVSKSPHCYWFLTIQSFIDFIFISLADQMAAALRHSNEYKKTASHADGKKPVYQVFEKLLKQTAGHELPRNAIIQKQVRTTNGVQVFVVGKPNGIPRAIYKFTNSPSATTTLLHHARTLKSHERLFKSADLELQIPKVFALYQNNMTVGLFESMVPGMTLRKLIREKGAQRLPNVMEDISTKLGRFYETQQDIINVVEQEIKTLVDDPIDLIASHLGGVSRAIFGRKLVALRAELNEALSWQQLAFGPIHGNLSPDNIILDPITSEMIGLIDWGSAEHNSYSAIDLFHLILAVNAQVDDQDVGTAVINALRKPRRFTPVTYLIADKNKLPASNESDRVLILLAWLHHLKSELSAGAVSQKSGVWRYKNIGRVLAKL